jgi:hypothetical protein
MIFVMKQISLWMEGSACLVIEPEIHQIAKGMLYKIEC